eukprot:CAMPEP_0182447706 /NCGR_PEP_ID=MMETSP1172-20130603/19083_1 /TAXON_ID=708627 /ORGANISM="Timspurckia oligopyrenoides, Strain CCMP3278" /LENGTH=343 /DNA_ID=CAMNT_0024644245 /DNA_START=327 /DNA_END=1361 /DNA_ORIENTATION=+
MVAKAPNQSKKSARKRKEQVVAVNNVSLEIPKGTIYGLLGPNSSGKTTLMRIMTTLERADSGTVELFGIDNAYHASYARKLFGFVAQDAGCDKVLTGREHLNFFGRLAHLSSSERRLMIEEAIETLNLEEFIDNLTGTYSGGVKKRLDIAIALLHRPQILILDEPTAGLDFDTRIIIWDLLKEYRKNGGTILISSHYLEEVDMLSDCVGILDRGNLISEGTPSELKMRVGGDRVSIRLSEFCSMQDAERALNLLRSTGLCEDGLINADFGNSLELIVKKSTDGGAAILECLKKNGFVKIFSFTVSQPSLGDVYLAATGRSIDSADMAAKELRDVKQMRQESMS